MSDGYGHSFSLSLSVIPRYLQILSFTYSADPGRTTVVEMQRNRLACSSRA